MGARESGKRSGIDARINSKMGVRHSGRAAEGGRLVGRKSAAWSGGGRPLGRAEDGRLVGRRTAAWSAEDGCLVGGGRPLGRAEVSRSVGGGRPLGRAEENQRVGAPRISAARITRCAGNKASVAAARGAEMLRRAARRTTNKYRPLRNGNQNNSSQSSAARTPYTAHCERVCAPHLKRFGREKQRIVSKVSEGQKIF